CALPIFRTARRGGRGGRQRRRPLGLAGRCAARPSLLAARSRGGHLRARAADLHGGDPHGGEDALRAADDPILAGRRAQRRKPALRSGPRPRPGRETAGDRAGTREVCWRPGAAGEDRTEGRDGLRGLCAYGRRPCRGDPHPSASRSGAALGRLRLWRRSRPRQARAHGRGGRHGRSRDRDERQSEERGPRGDHSGDPRGDPADPPPGRHRRARPPPRDRAGQRRRRARRGGVGRGPGARGLSDRWHGATALRRPGGSASRARRTFEAMSTHPSRNEARFSLGEIATVVAGELRGPKDLAVVGVGTDSRALWPGALFVALRGERFDGHTFLPAAATRAAAAIGRRGYEPPASLASFPLIRVDDPLAALGALARAHRDRFPELRLGAVTGSNGKTTTKELAAAVLEAAFGKTLKTEGNLNNEIGLPLTLLRLDASHRAACVEMGMNHPGEIARLTAIARPRAGLVTCAQPVHLQGLGSVEGVARAKGELYAGLEEDAIAVVNADDPLMVEQARRSGRRCLSFGGS